MTLYFAYGSNMDTQRLAHRGIRPRERRGATLVGYRLVFNKIADVDPRRGYANIETHEGGRVEGVLYDLAATDLDGLDKYEGARSGHYRRINVTVWLENGIPMEAITYQAEMSRVTIGLKPTREYMSHLLAGREFLTPEYLQVLENIPTID